MNFFEHQDKARRKTGRLVFLFLLAVVCIVAGTVGMIYGVLYYVGFDYPEIHYLIREEPLWFPISATVLIIIVLGTLIRTLQLLGGGQSVAEMVGAVPIGPEHSSFEVKRFLNVVDEMAIASGVPVPKLYLLSDDSINAFVAGRKPKDTVMVVTQGALDNLNRQELQAVVGHEFSHIFNADIKISLRLIGLLGGILAVGQIGYFMMRFSGMGSSRRSGKAGNHAAIILIGLGLFILGYIGLFFGRVIKAAISRERELLADACSVQYTRNPHGLVSAFKVMQLHQQGTHLKNRHSEDVNHFCFAPALSMMFGSVLATHPPLEKRIKRIDPKGQYEILPRTKVEEDMTPKKSTTKDFIPMMLATSIIVANAEQVKQSIAHPSDEHVDYAQALNTLIPDELRTLARDPQQVMFLLYAMLVPDDFQQKTQVLTKLRHEYSEQDIQKVVYLKGLMHKMPAAAYLPLFEFALPTFTKLNKEHQVQAYQKLHQVMSDFQGDTFHYVLSILLAKQIQDKRTFNKQEKQTLKGILREVMYLLVVLLKASHQSEDEQKQCFAKVSQSLFQQSLPWPKVKRIKFDLLTKALEKINALKPLDKEKVIDACITVVTFDGKVLVPEAELLRAVCEILECPMPPLLSQSVD